MGKIVQLNFGASESSVDDILPYAICNCLLIEDSEQCVLIDAGLGLLEIDTLLTLSQKIPEIYGTPIETVLPAARQLPLRGYNCCDVKSIVLTHLDLDHAGGLKDFPNAEVHLSLEEYIGRNNPRYLQDQFEHFPKWKPRTESRDTWFGLEARTLTISKEVDIILIPLPGHTMGHCGVAVREKNSTTRWILHVGDAYYNRKELYDEGSSVRALSDISAADNTLRLASLAKIANLLHRHGNEIEVICSHDPEEQIDANGLPSSSTVGTQFICGKQPPTTSLPKYIESKSRFEQKRLHSVARETNG